MLYILYLYIPFVGFYTRANIKVRRVIKKLRGSFVEGQLQCSHVVSYVRTPVNVCGKQLVFKN